MQELRNETNDALRIYAQNRYCAVSYWQIEPIPRIFSRNYITQSCVRTCVKRCTYITILMMKLCTYIIQRCTYITILQNSSAEKKERTPRPNKDIKFISFFHNDKKFCCRGFTFILLKLSGIFKKIQGVFPLVEFSPEKNGYVRTSFQGVLNGQGVY